MATTKIIVFYSLIIAVLIQSCAEKQNEATPNDCDTIELNSSFQYNDILKGIDIETLSQTTEQPDVDGALSRNKEGYFSVRFQINISKLTDLAVISERIDVLEEYSKALAYSFNSQNSDGSYQLNPPSDLINDPSIEVPTKGDSISAIAFFAYALSISLNSLEESDWFNITTETDIIKSQLEDFKPNIEKTLSYLMDNESTLKEVDGEAPNRLLFDAIAFYGLGKYLNDQEAQTLGIEFSNLAMSQLDEEEGYFIEGGGWDSSYNGVAIKLGLELFSMLPENHSSKDALGNRLACATKWQESRVLDSGEISTEGNTRVYSGGESFLGNEKEVDVEKTVRAFYYFSVLADDESYKELADKILSYYR